MPLAGRTNYFDPPMPKGYQAPLPPGLSNQDQVKQAGAPKGYQWDPVKGAYVPALGAVGNEFASLQGLMGAIGGSGSGSSSSYSGNTAPSSAPPIQAPSIGAPSSAAPSAIAPIAPIDTSAADSAIFAKAKDQVGQTSQGALTGLRSALAGRGMLGSGAESRGTASIINRGQGELGDVSRTQAIKNVDTNLDVAKTNQGATLSGRGQDISREQSQNSTNASMAMDRYQGQIAQRGQDIQHEESQAQLQLTKSLQEAAQRQQILQGILGATKNGSTLY
jgi:hypothetical protein